MREGIIFHPHTALLARPAREKTMTLPTARFTACRQRRGAERCHFLANEWIDGRKEGFSVPVFCIRRIGEIS